jgi:hypothetical protein
MRSQIEIKYRSISLPLIGIKWKNGSKKTQFSQNQEKFQKTHRSHSKFPSSAVGLRNFNESESSEFHEAAINRKFSFVSRLQRSMGH